MGFLSTKGGVLTFNQYKEKIERYKRHGLSQFICIYNCHKDRFIPLADLKWGEEMEYQLYVNDKKSCSMKLSNRGPEIIEEFNKTKYSSQNEVLLMPEFGGWMIEAVPTKPYNSLIDAKSLLSCE